MKTFFLSPSGKRAFMLIARLLIFSALAFAQEDPFGLSKPMETLLKVVSSPWVKGIAVVALIVECIALITAGRQEPGMFKKFVPWIVGTILFMAAATITETFLKPEDSGITEVLGR
jgi:type IV secretory pathway VirB2 component (pilin)